MSIEVNDSDGGTLELLFFPFKSLKYNWIARYSGHKIKLKLDFIPSLMMLLITPSVWARAVLTLNVEPYVLGRHRAIRPCRPAEQMYLTWFGFPKDKEGLEAFQPGPLETLLMTDHEHQPERVTNLCVDCGIYCAPDYCSSDEEEKDERCLCGKRLKRCKCKKCTICGLTELACECQICAECGKCRCDKLDLHREQHLSEESACVCDICEECGKTACFCDESSESNLFS